MEEVKVYKEDLATREPSDDEQATLDARSKEIVDGKRKDEDLFDKKEETPKEKPKEKTPEKKEPEEGAMSDEDVLDAKDEDLNDKQKSRKKELTIAKETLDKEKEDEKILEAKDEDLNDKQKARKTELVKEKESTKSDEDKKKDLAVEVKAYATEHKVSEEDAQKDIESIGKIVANSKGDAKIIAKSYLHLQRSKARTDEALKALRNAPPPIEATDESIEKAIEAGRITMKGKPATKEQLIEGYRDKYPEATEGAGDDNVYAMIKKDMRAGFENRQVNTAAEMGKAAIAKKDKLISELSEDAKKFLPEIKPIVDSLSDAQIMNPNFDLEEYVYWSKGKTYDTAVKDAEERGFKRGVEARKIVGEIPAPGEGKSKTKKTGSNKYGLTDVQKQAAEQHFENDQIPVERKYELYKEILEHEEMLKNRKKKEEEKNK